MLANVLSEVESFRTLGAVMQWTLARKPTAELFAVVTQDEFTHDIVIRVAPEVFLVFDTT